MESFKSTRLGFSLTSRCNLKCLHCLQGSHDAVDLNPEVLQKILKQSKQLGISHISLSGGEPTLYPHLAMCVRKLKDLGLTFSLTTNGLLLEKILRTIKVHLPTHITVSLDGHDSSTHEAIRGSGTFTPTVNTIKFLTIIGVRVYLQCTLLKPQLKNLDKMYDMASSLGVEALVLSLPVPTANLLTSHLFPSSDELLAAKRWIKCVGGRSTLAAWIAIGNQVLADPADTQMARPRCSFLMGKNLFIDWNGRLCLCCQTSAVGDNNTEVVADLSQVSFQKAITVLRRYLHEMLHTNKMVMSNTTDAFACLACCRFLNKLPAVCI